MWFHLPRVSLATLPTPLEPGPVLPGGAELWVKRDDLTGLGMGGNKARKLEFLCGAAVEAGADSLITVGAGQSNHCRMTAAAGARLDLETHLVLAGDRPDTPTGNQLLSVLFGAQLHYTGADEHHWGELAVASESLTEELERDGASPFEIPIGGSTATGAVGYLVAYVELMEQCDQAGLRPAAIVHTSSSGGTHAGLVAGRAVRRATGRSAPPIVAIGVAKGVNAGHPDVVEMAGDVLALVDVPAGADITAADVEIDAGWIGDDYAIPTAAGDDAIRWGAQRGGWVFDRVYTGKGCAGLLGHAAAGRWGTGETVVFIHTGGSPAVFAPGGAPLS